MQHLTEDKVKAALRKYRLPVPEGLVAASPEEAADAARQIGGPVVVKALVPTGRRGKAGAIGIAGTPEEAGALAAKLIGSNVNGFLCEAAYVEAKVDIAKEVYVSFVLEDFPARVLLSTEGGVDIETVNKTNPDAIVSAEIDPLRGVPTWDAVALWEKAGLETASIPALAMLTARLYSLFVKLEGVMLELNPIALDADGKPHIVGAMLATEDSMFETKDDIALADGTAGDGPSERERRVVEANRKFPGGMVRYKELDGDIGMFVGGGGASLYQHDLILAAGGRPANHTDASTQNMDKVRALIDVILDNPRVKSLFVSWHYQQMARIEKRVIPVVEALKARSIDPKTFPVVIRMFGPGEEEARASAAEIEGIRYMPHGAPLTDGIRMIVDLTSRVSNPEKQTELV